MRQKIRALIQIVAVLGFAFLLWRFFPFAIGFVEGAALNLRRFWWLILMLVLSAWAFWVLAKRN